MALGTRVNEPQIGVLQAKPEHLAEIEALWRSIARESNPEDDRAPYREVKGLYRSLQTFNLLESDSFWLFLARVDGNPVGYLTTVRIPKADDRIGVLYIDELYVLETYRRRGVGSALVQEVCRIGQELTFWRVRLNADENDPGVCAFYETNGFRHGGNGFFQRQISRVPENRPPP